MVLVSVPILCPTILAWAQSNKKSEGQACVPQNLGTDPEGQGQNLGHIFSKKTEGQNEYF
jgi:hypothetical protein